MDIYKRLENLSEFEWDEGNTEKNIEKHGISNTETEEIFFNFNLINFDQNHSQNEERYWLLGETNEGKILFTVFTTREEKIRVISSRMASRRERQIFNRTKRKYEKYS